MSGPGSNVPLGIGGEAAGSQAQYNLFLQLLARIVKAIENEPTATPYTVFPWTTAGNLNVASAFPGLTTGTISVRQTVPTALNVTLPTSGGPWIVADGAGVAGANHISVLPPGGLTINGSGSAFVISTNWQAAIFILDGTNYIANVL